ncbi:PhoH family protein [Spirochaeta cellobiosiphila]|uniref:PhoH family protein n=1 Tax=Spirochaeta cellobiosiphila TaxID=504483 RepID=UPI000401A1AB|nr:PhoH family protein [Spirochaeta cellobiosiphila]
MSAANNLYEYPESNPQPKPKKERIKQFVLDTNVFIHRPDAIMSFRNNEIVIPLWVLEELDKLKIGHEERARNARHAIRILNKYAEKGDLTKGVKMENNSILRIATRHAPASGIDMDLNKIDNKIILVAYNLHKTGWNQVFFVSKDINARVKAAALGIKAVDYEKQKVNIDTLFQGYREILVKEDVIENLSEYVGWDSEHEMLENEFALLKWKEDKSFKLTRHNKNVGGLHLLSDPTPRACNIHPLNVRQTMALNLLLDDDIPLVSLVGKAGTGKTLLALASGLRKILEGHVYTRMLISRPIIPMGKDIGYLPGGKDDKLSHWMQPVFDNLEYIMNVYKSQNLKSLDQLLKTKTIEIEALTYIRGRSLPRQFIIIDEAQNLTPHEVKTIVSRAGQGSKVVLTGDPYQIDSPYLDSNSNGLTYLVETLKGQPLYGHITLEKSERSPLSELAAELL